jgi:hypothetical protein
MIIDLDLNGERDIKALYLVLQSCISLENLEINIKVWLSYNYIPFVFNILTFALFVNIVVYVYMNE